MDRDDAERLAVDYATTRDPATRAEAVIAHQTLARIVARQMHFWWEPLDDLIQVANVGLLEALERYDPAMGTFGTYAQATMRGVLHHHVRTTRASQRSQDIGRRMSETVAYDDLTDIDRRVDIAAMLSVLPDRDRTVLELGFLEGYTQHEVAAALGLTQTEVSRITRAAIVRLRAYGEG